jgi:hypothetical protein
VPARKPSITDELIKGDLLSDSEKPFAEGHKGELLNVLTSPHPHGMGLGANGAVPEAGLKERFLKRGAYTDADYEKAMQSCIEHEWVKRVSDRVQLTEEGYQICK